MGIAPSEAEDEANDGTLYCFSVRVGKKRRSSRYRRTDSDEDTTDTEVTRKRRSRSKKKLKRRKGTPHPKRKGKKKKRRSAPSAQEQEDAGGGGDTGESGGGGDVAAQDTSQRRLRAESESETVATSSEVPGSSSQDEEASAVRHSDTTSSAGGGGSAAEPVGARSAPAPRGRKVPLPDDGMDYGHVDASGRRSSMTPSARSYPRPLLKGPRSKSGLNRVKFSGLDIHEDEAPKCDPRVPSVVDEAGESGALPKKPTLEDLRVPQLAMPDKDVVHAKFQFSPGRLLDKYIMTKVELGTGATGVVKMAFSKDQTEQYAVKIIPKSSKLLKDMEFMEEIDILSRLKHHSIIQLQDKYEDRENVYLVMELAQGGELFDRILDKKRFSETYVRKLAHSLFDAIAYLHAQGITHRDIKPENILFAKQDADSDVKISDFGFAKHLNNKEQLMRAKSRRGTMGYAAPEIFSGIPYDEKCDVWSLGIVLYIMLSGVPPFCDFEDPERALRTPFWRHASRMEKVPNHPVDFPEIFWSTVSDTAKSFIALCLRTNPARRPRAVDLLKHPWLKRAGRLGKGGPAAMAHTGFHPSIGNLQMDDAFSSLR